MEIEEDNNINISWEDIDLLTNKSPTPKPSKQSPILKHINSPNVIPFVSTGKGIDLFIGGLPIDNPLPFINKIIDQSIIIGNTRMKHGKHFAYAFIRVKKDSEKDIINKTHSITIDDITATLSIKYANEKVRKVFFSGLNKSSSGSVILNTVNALGVDHNGIVLYKRKGATTGCGYIKVKTRKGMDILLSTQTSPTCSIKFQRYVSPKWSHSGMITSLKNQVTKMKSIISGLSKKIDAMVTKKKKKKKTAAKVKVVEQVTPKSTVLKPSTPKPSLMKKKKTTVCKKRQRSPNNGHVSPEHKRNPSTANTTKQVSHPIIVATPFIEQPVQPMQHIDSPLEKSLFSNEIMNKLIELLQHLTHVKNDTINTTKSIQPVQSNMN